MSPDQRAAKARAPAVVQDNKNPFTTLQNRRLWPLTNANIIVFRCRGAAWEQQATGRASSRHLNWWCLEIADRLKASATGMLIQELWTGSQDENLEIVGIAAISTINIIGNPWSHGRGMTVHTWLCCNLIVFYSISPIFSGSRLNNKIVGCISCRWWLPELRNRVGFRCQFDSADQSTKHVLSRLTIIVVFQWYFGPRGSCYSRKTRHCIKSWCNEYKFRKVKKCNEMIR